MKITKSDGLRALLVSLGSLGVGISMALLLSVDLGSSTIGTLTNGVSSKLAISNGVANLAISFFFFILVLIFGREYIKMGTILSAVIIGVSIYFGQKIFSPFHLENLTFFVRILLVLIATVSLAYSLALYVSMQFGMAPYEAIICILQKKTGWQLKHCKQLCDATVVVIGALLGATFGIGTIIAVIFTGVILQRALAFLNKQYAKSPIMSKLFEGEKEQL